LKNWNETHEENNWCQTTFVWKTAPLLFALRTTSAWKDQQLTLKPISASSIIVWNNNIYWIEGYSNKFEIFQQLLWRADVYCIVLEVDNWTVAFKPL